ncbi:MAG: DUF72 domain-containing protein [Chitinophagaceae bacterium]|nr:MAG: DUF72 domain-containing protein [Chitinophagaceae bacterium]
MAKKPGLGKLYIGTSNIVVPGNRQSFPEPFRTKSRLHYYSTLFNSLEVNSSFYKVPLGRTFERWTTEVTPGFCFTVKLWKGITHNKLNYDPAEIEKFLLAADHLKDTRACLLIQFPAGIRSDLSGEVFEILNNVRLADPEEKWRIAVEFRHQSWYFREIYELLNEYDATMVIHDIPASRVTEQLTDAAFVYLRFHGPKGDYRDSYSDEILAQRAAQIFKWMKAGKDVYAYFNNTIGNAFDNAALLKKMVNELSKPRFA